MRVLTKNREIKYGCEDKHENNPMWVECPFCGCKVFGRVIDFWNKSKQCECGAMVSEWYATKNDEQSAQEQPMTEKRQNLIMVDLDKPFVEQIRFLINVNNVDTAANMPDWILAEHLMRCIDAFVNSTDKIKKHYGIEKDNQ